MTTTDGEQPKKAASEARRRETATVEDEWELAFVLSERHTVPTRARFTFHADDPYAAHLLFHLYSQEPVSWVFARELLTTGMSRPAGMADVLVRPGLDPTLVRLSLASTTGYAQFDVPVTPLAAWLDRTHLLVPAGVEDRHLHLDEHLETLRGVRRRPRGTDEAS